MGIYCKKMEAKNIEKVLMLFNKLREESAEITFTDVTNKREIEKWLTNSNYYLYIAVVDEEIISVFRGIRGVGEEDHCLLVTIATDPNYRSQGVANKLILYSLKDIKERQKSILLARAYIYSDNRASLNTMLSCGFSVSGSIYQHHYDKKKNSYVDDIIFHKIL